MKLLHLLKNLWEHISRRRRVQLVGVFVLILLSAVGELASIGAIVPFLAALTSPKIILSNPYMQQALKTLGFETNSQIILFLTAIFTIAVACAGVARYLLLWAQTRLSFSIGADLSAEIYLRTLYQPYEVHLSRNSSEIISAINVKVRDVVNQCIGPSMNIISSAFLLISIGACLFFINPEIAAASFLVFGGIYIVIAVSVKRRLIMHGNVVAAQQSEVLKTLQEGTMGIRDVLLSNAQDIYVGAFSKAHKMVNEATANIIIISQAPRYVIEAAGMMLVAVMAYFLVIIMGNTNVLAIIGALALGAQRMLPLLQQAYWSYSQLHGGKASLNDILLLLNQPMHSCLENSRRIGFKRDIELREVVFSYDRGRSRVLDGVNLRIPKGACVGVIGATGSGKSTLIDIIMGLVLPSSGSLFIDNVNIGPPELRSWQEHIAHVPQSIYLSDSSIAQNIAFGVPPEKINLARVKCAARQAHISNVIESWVEGYQTKVGEQGTRLSGGQRQRIGIARALYRGADLLILDEATSALDQETEIAVMEEVGKLSASLTVILIAHRVSTLRQCDLIIHLSNGIIHRIGSYQEFIQISTQQNVANMKDIAD